MALTIAQVETIRRAVMTWRRGGGLSGPKPDGQLEAIIEVMLGTSARIGEVLAICKCDVDATCSPSTVRICGTVSYTHLRAHETVLDLVCRLLLEKKKKI